MSKDWCDIDKSFLHGSNWTEKIVGKFEKYIHYEPSECHSIAELALTSGVVELWEKNHDHPFSFMAWLLTTDNFKFGDDCLDEANKLKQKLCRIMDDSVISQPLRACLYISFYLRNKSFFNKKNDLFECWDKKTINHKILSHNINYLNLRGADLENVDLSDLKLPANFKKANFKGADLSNADLRGALVSEEQLSHAIINHKTRLPSFEIDHIQSIE